ncbi:HlyD family secretion protein [Brumimicrobium aurantiacum]|uniref:Biotin/lipoyl-binding protein n=1 Tax=Brumimicrobium aurantiacum TaxID=1737063 RepID=A0A3E1EZY9_9FLAO|nr:biotin/lipoyl-binding protein [Brumimicrobium aurantiacum]RFC55142.1 biotin/lipoyl-binding protein [Brumimicrobium aurantiacum]
MKSYKTILLSSLVLMLATSCTENEQITSQRGKVKYETISISGKLAGRVSKLYVEEGQKVKKGDTLAFIDVPEVTAKMMQTDGAIMAAEGQLDMAINGATKEQLNQVEQKLKAAQAQLDFAQESYRRLENMHKDSLVSQQQFDEVKMKRAMAKAQVDAVKAKKQEIVKGARAEQINQAKGQLDRALGAKEEVNVASNEKYLIAPVDMSIETISLKEGELLTPGYALINGYETNSIYFRLTVPESKIYDFKINQEVTLENPYTNARFPSKIVAIKQLAKYANITSTTPLYTLDESIYELKIVPLKSIEEGDLYLNSTVLLK